MYKLYIVKLFKSRYRNRNCYLDSSFEIELFFADNIAIYSDFTKNKLKIKDCSKLVFLVSAKESLNRILNLCLFRRINIFKNLVCNEEYILRNICISNCFYLSIYKTFDIICLNLRNKFCSGNTDGLFTLNANSGFLAGFFSCSLFGYIPLIDNVRILIDVLSISNLGIAGFTPGISGVSKLITGSRLNISKLSVTNVIFCIDSSVCYLTSSANSLIFTVSSSATVCCLFKLSLATFYITLFPVLCSIGGPGSSRNVFGFINFTCFKGFCCMCCAANRTALLINSLRYAGSSRFKILISNNLYEITGSKLAIC